MSMHINSKENNMKNLAIFYGGKSSEHDISIITAIQVMKNLDKRKYNIFPVYITQNNSWLMLKKYLDINIYANKNFKGSELVTGFFNGSLMKKNILGFKTLKKIDVSINCMHGLNGEDGTLAGMLELAEIPYVGSGVVASAVGMDKVIMKDVFKANNIPCARYLGLKKEDINSNEMLDLAERKLGYPIIVKPANLGSSIGINISNNREELIKNIEIALNFDKKIILEQVIPNLREINCSVIGCDDYVETSLLEEPIGWKTFLNFDEKYIQKNANGSKVLDVHVSEDIDKKIKSLSIKVFKLLGCSGIVRIDYLFDDKSKKVYVNEINTIPGSYANYLWRDKYTFSVLLDRLIDMAVKEYICKNKYKYTFSSYVLDQYGIGGNINKNKCIK